jgi:uncharacterized protein YbjT (DUF2867 family)
MAVEDAPVLVTGATGTVGRHVVAGLREHGVPVRAATRNPDGASEALGGGVEPVRFDFTEPATHGPAFDGVRRLFLVRPPALSDVQGEMVPAIEAGLDRDLRRVVLLSVLGAGQMPGVPHRTLERFLGKAPLAATSLRASFFMQNLSTTHRADVRDRNTIFLPAGRGRTSFVDARDVAAVAVRTLLEDRHQGRAYALTGEEALTYEEAASVFSDVLGRPITYANPSLPAFWQEMRRRGHPPGKVAVMAAIYTTCRLGLAGTVTAWVRSLLGRPARSLSAFVAEHRAVWSPAAASGASASEASGASASEASGASA